MYRRSLAALWTGTIVFGAAATLDAFIDYMKNAQGILIAAFAMMFFGAMLHIGFHRLNETAKVNGQRATELLELSEKKTAQVRGDVDKLSQQVTGMGGTVDEMRDWAEAQVLVDEGRHPPTPPEAEHEPCPVYPLPVRDGRREAIIGRRTDAAIDPDQIWAALDANTTGPGRHSAS